MSEVLRPYDDGRWPELESGHADCFLCGKPVDPLDPKRGAYDEPPAGPKLPIHLPCLDGRSMIAVSFAYHVALTEMSDRQLKVANLR